jgi:uncharacterized protein YjbI with pentapeptide repeats
MDVTSITPDLTYILPQEIIEKILQYLQTRDLCNFVRLNKRCYNVASGTKLWRNIRISKKKIIESVLKEDKSPLPSHIPRFEDLNKIDLSYMYLLPNDWCAIFYSIINSKKVQYLDISHAQNLEYVDEKLIAQSLAGLKVVKMNKLNLPDHRLQTIFKQMLIENITKELHISLVDLSQMPMNLFQQMVNTLDVLNVKNCYMDPLHIDYIFDVDNRNVESGARIEFSCESTQVHGSLSASDDVFVRDILKHLFSSVNKLDFKLVDFSGVSTEMWTRMLTSMSPTMESLSIEGMGLDLVNVPVSVIGPALASPIHLNLSGPDMSAAQWSNFFTHLTSNTKSLSLRMVNLSFVDVQLIGNALIKIKSVTMNYVCFETAQWNYLFQHTFPKISDLSVVNINLSEIQDSSLASTARWCNKLSLSSTYLNLDQRNLVLNTVRLNTSLKTLNLAGLILVEVSPDLLANVVASIPVVNLAATKIASKQTTAIFSRLLSSCKLRELDLGGLSLSQVPSRLLALALSRLRSANLINTIISREQLQELNTQIQNNYSALEYLAISRNMLLINRMNLAGLSSHVYLHLV